MSTGLSRYAEDRDQACSELLQHAIYILLDSEEFNAAITFGTNDARKVKTRFRMMRETLNPSLPFF